MNRRDFVKMMPMAAIGIPLLPKRQLAQANLPQSGSDDGPAIKAMLDGMPQGGALRLQAGVYRIETPISKVISGDAAYLLEGEGDATKLIVSCDPGIEWLYQGDQGHVAVRSMQVIPGGSGAGSLITAQPISGYAHGRFTAEDISFVNNFPAGGIHWLMALYRMRGSVLRNIRLYGGTGTSGRVLLDTEASNSELDRCLAFGSGVGYRITGRHCTVNGGAILNGAVLEAMESGGALQLHGTGFDGGALSVFNQSGGPVMANGCTFANYFFANGSVRIGQDAGGGVDGIQFNLCQFPTHFPVRAQPNPRINVLAFHNCHWQYGINSVTGYPVVISPGGTIGDLVFDGVRYDGINSNQSMGLLDVGVYSGNLTIERLSILNNELKDWNGANTGRVLIGLSVAGSGQWLHVGKLTIRGNRAVNTRPQNLNQYLAGLWGPVTVADAFVSDNDLLDVLNREFTSGNGAVANATYKRNRGLDE